MTHEGQRSVAELGAILWHALGGALDAPEFEPQIAPPHTDPVVALAHLPPAPRRVRRARSDRPQHRVPGTARVAHRNRARQGRHARRRRGVAKPRDRRRMAHALRVYLDTRADRVDDPPACDRRAVGGRRQQRTRGGVRARGLVGAGDTRGRRRSEERRDRTAPERDRQADDGADRDPGGARVARRTRRSRPPCGTVRCRTTGKGRTPRAHRATRCAHPRARRRRRGSAPHPSVRVEAIVLRTAGEGWRVGAACPVREWSDGWAGYAELGAVAWAAIDDLDRRTDSNTWSAMEQAFREDRLAHASAHPALEATSALVRKMLEQTGRNHVAHAPDERTLCALEVPARLWRALAEAGPCPQAAGATGIHRSVVARGDRAPGRRRAECGRALESRRRRGRARSLPRGRGRQQPAVPHGGHLAHRGRRRAHASGRRRAWRSGAGSTIRTAPRAKRARRGSSTRSQRPTPDRLRGPRPRSRSTSTTMTRRRRSGRTGRAPPAPRRRGKGQRRRDGRSQHSSRSNERLSPKEAKTTPRDAAATATVAPASCSRARRSGRTGSARPTGRGTRGANGSWSNAASADPPPKTIRSS